MGPIGIGLIGTPYARTLQKVDECELVAVADVDEKHREMAAKLGVKYYQDYEEMIRRKTLQGVIIATPNHPFVEKPIAPSLAEADRLIEAATRNRVRILVGHQRRFNALVE